MDVIEHWTLTFCFEVSPALYLVMVLLFQAFFCQSYVTYRNNLVVCFPVWMWFLLFGLTAPTRSIMFMLNRTCQNEHSCLALDFFSVIFRIYFLCLLECQSYRKREWARERPFFHWLILQMAATARARLGWSGPTTRARNPSRYPI